MAGDPAILKPAYQPISPLCVDGPAGETGGACRRAAQRTDHAAHVAPVVVVVQQKAPSNPGAASEAKKVLDKPAHRPVRALLKDAPYFDGLSDTDLAHLVALSARTA